MRSGARVLILVAAVVAAAALLWPSEEEEIVAPQLRRTVAPAASRPASAARRQGPRLRESDPVRPHGSSRPAVQPPTVPTLRPLAPSGEKTEEQADDSPAGIEHTLLEATSPEDRSDALLDATTVGNDAESARLLLLALNDEDPSVRREAVEALWEFTEEISPEDLLPGLKDEDAGVRLATVDLLGDIDTPEAIALVRLALDDPDEEVRELAADIIDLADED